MKMTYRGHKRLRTLGLTVGCLLIAGILIWVCWLMWLQRFVVYSGDRAYLVFDWESTGEAVEALPQELPTVPILYNEGDNTIDTTIPLAQINGYYITTSNLLDGVDAVRSAIDALEPGSVIMLDLKSIYGNFYYSSDVADGNVTDQIDTEAVDRLITEITKGNNYYVIARMPAFRDRAYGLQNTNYGLAHSSGGYLWYDSSNCYWLDPTSSGTMNYLTSIADELRGLGFDEVVFTEFRFPDTTDIIFNSSLTRAEALAQAAQTLVEECATDSFAVSFETSDNGFTLPEGRTRLYLSGVEASAAASTAEAVTVPDKQANLVFVTESNDTRYDSYSTMRPILIIN